MRLVQGVRLRGARPPLHADWAVPEEIPVAFRYNGFPHAVMMATPADLEDFALGFSITEGIAVAAAEVVDLKITATADEISLDIALASPTFHGFLRRRRQRALSTHTSCGLCGVEELGDVCQPARRVPEGPPLTDKAVQRALAAVRDFQPLGRETGATHAAAWAAPDGEITLVREDVGRHNALDKLIGACLRKQLDFSAGFCLVTSRCSFEMAQKAIAVGIPALIAISAPTALAIRIAKEAGLTLVALARGDSRTIYNAAGRIVAESNCHEIEAKD
jgi:FdhD protein